MPVPRPDPSTTHPATSDSTYSPESPESTGSPESPGSPDAPGSPASPGSPELPLRAKPLPGLPSPPRPGGDAEIDLVPARMVNEVLYCERLMYLEWVQGEFDDNFFTVEGRVVHRRADQPSGKLAPPGSPTPGAREGANYGGGSPSAAGPNAEAAKGPDAAGEAKEASSGAGREALPASGVPAHRAAATAKAVENRDDQDDAASEPLPYVARSVWLSSERLGLTAKVDIIEGNDAGSATPIEYKRGHAPDVPERAYLPERAQVCAQALLLRDHGYRCDKAEIYFAADRRRVTIDIDEVLVATTQRAVARARELAQGGALPAPLLDSPKCNGCSLVAICLPDEVGALQPHADPEVTPTDELAVPENVRVPEDPDLEPAPDVEPDRTTRRLHPARDDRIPLYVQTQGAYLSLDGEELVVKGREGATRARLPNLSQVSLYGNIQVTTPALRTLLDRGIPVSFFSYGGWFIGRAIGLDSKNVHLRMRQFRAAGQGEFCLRMARGFVVSKILNCRTMLRRNAESVSATILFELKQLARKAAEAESLPSLLGIEGSAARVYFGAFTGMLSERALADGFDFEGRNRRPPKDPVNALLSFVYGMLTKDFVIALTQVGLDPLLGFYHQPRHGRPALALDMLEEFRPLLGDSVVVGAINTGVVRPNDFLRSPVGVGLTAPGRKRLIEAYERRMDQLVTHPVFGYRISYRRVLEVQCRLLTRLLFGEISAYPAFRTR